MLGILLIFTQLMFCRMTSTMANLKELRNLRTRLTSPYPFGGPERTPVPHDKIDWTIEFPEYSPPYFTSPSVLGKPWADKEDREGIKWNTQDGKIDRTSFTGTYLLDEQNYPLNPVGRTGIRGRGNLGKWAVNHACDPVVTRWKNPEYPRESNSDEKPILQFVAIQRRDTLEWAIPGGMIDNGETVKDALMREFMEECFSIDDANEEEKRKLYDTFSNLFENHGTEIYKGIVDDRRATDNAWIETVCMNFHTDNVTITNLTLKAGSDAKNAKWTDIHSSLNLYASHKKFIEKVALMHNAAW